MASTADFRNGLTLEMDNGLYTIVEFQHVKPGKGSAFVRTKLKNITTGRVISKTFPAGHKVNVARVERRKHQYLYREDDVFYFMNTETFEQIPIEASLIEKPEFLKDGMEVDILFHADTETPLLVDLPAYVVMEVTYTEPGEKGNTATNTLKDAKVETGATVKVPLFINTGDLIKVDTRDGSYSERVKK